jgi:hypothetical protein
MNSPAPKKRGQLSLEEEKYIRDSITTHSLEEIADHLNRNSAPVKRYVMESGLIQSDNDKSFDEYIRYRLHQKSFWPFLKQQFSETQGEIKLFEDIWVGLLRQFKEDVLPAEEIQIKQFITIEILNSRNLKDRQRHELECEKIQRLITEEYLQPESTRDSAKLLQLEAQLNVARASVTAYTNEYTKLLSEQQKISKDLKATREQRIRRIEDGKSSWAGLIRMLEDEQVREKEGREMEILAIATDRVRRNLTELHNFQDKTVDKPFLLPEDAENNE